MASVLKKMLPLHSRHLLMPCIRWTSTFVFLRSQREGSQERDRREEGGRGRKPADKRNRWWQMSSKAGHPAKYLSDGQRSAARPATACTEQSFGWNASQESENSAAQPVLRGVRLDASPTTQEEERHTQSSKKPRNRFFFGQCCTACLEWQGLCPLDHRTCCGSQVPLNIEHLTCDILET
jgi:hypothetical protein